MLRTAPHGSNTKGKFLVTGIYNNIIAQLEKLRKHNRQGSIKTKARRNDRLDLERRTTGNLDRTWSDDEFGKMLQIAYDSNRTDYTTALHLAYHAGLRIEECFTIDTAMTEHALRTHTITFHGKNGRWRTVPIDQNIAKVLRERLDKVKRGSKLLTPDDMTVENAIHNFQAFIERHRGMAESPNRQTPLTAHGLRHSYACRLYLDGKSLHEISRLLGHKRPGVVRVYLAGALDGGGAE